MANSMHVAQRFKLRLEILPFHKKMLSKIMRETCQKDMETNVKGLPTHKGFNLSMENNIITIDDNTINPKINI